MRVQSTPVILRFFLNILARLSAIFQRQSLFFLHMRGLNTIWMYDNDYRERWRDLEIFPMEETSEFFSLHFIALSRSPPCWPGCSCSRLRSAQGLWSASWFRRSIASRPGVPFSSTILLYGASPPKLVCPCLVPSYGSFSSRTIGFKSVHEMALHEIFFQWKGFLLRICNSTPLSG